MLNQVGSDLIVGLAIEIEMLGIRYLVGTTVLESENGVDLVNWILSIFGFGIAVLKS